MNRRFWFLMGLLMLGVTVVAGILLASIWENDTNDDSLSLFLTALVTFGWVASLSGLTITGIGEADERRKRWERENLSNRK